jgi:hypothetical protein
MKKLLRKLILVTVAATGVFTANAQQVATFENLTLAPNSYWNGSATPGGTTFTSGDAIFPNVYSGYWSKGWAYSNQKDSTTAGYTNMYSARAGSGYNSANYAIGQQGAIARLNANAIHGKATGVYITNGTYAAISMRDGDSFARKFGDTTGTKSGLPPGSYPDWFKLTIKGFSNGALKTDSVNFLLADYTFADNSKDYIVTTWKWVDLTSLGNVDSLIFKLTSSDVGKFGINTPLFFCVDNFTTESLMTGIAAANVSSIKMYPNPATDNLTIDMTSLYNGEANTVDIFDLSGKRMETVYVNSPLINLSIADYKAGVYLISVKNNNTVINAKFIKN